MRRLMMILHALAYAGLVAAGTFVIARRAPPAPPSPPPPCVVFAQRELPRNYRLGAGDVLPAAVCDSSWAGGYLPRAVGKGERIALSEVLRLPVFPVEKGRAAVLSDAASTPLNAGAVVDMYREGNLIASEALVLAVLCPAGKCDLAVLSLEPPAVAALQKSQGPTLYVVRSIK
jgi:hypothetical protein